jgi:hypothetical protein
MPIAGLESGLVVVQLDHRRGLVVVGTAVVVDLPLPVHVEDHGEPSAAGRSERVLEADSGQPGLS